MHKFCFVFLLLLTFLCSFTVTTPVTFAAWQPSLSIGLLQGQTSVRLATEGKTTTVTVKNGKLTVNDKSIDAETFDLVPTNKTEPVVSVNGTPYRGSIRIELHQGIFTVINRVQTEDYLKGVLPKEMPAEWPAEAQKAQAIAARTFALKNRGRHKDAGFDLCNTTHCQLYAGVSGERTGSTAAVDATYGEVLTYDGNLIDAVFHTDSGGMTGSSAVVWGTKIPYLVPATERQTKTQPWTRTWTADAFLTKLAQKKALGTLKSVELSPLTIGKTSRDRSVSGRVLSATFVGKQGTLRLTGNELRSLLGLPSTLFDIAFQKGSVTITGYGAGHGLGLSQWGAKAWADAGEDTESILTHYYAGTTLKELYKK